VESHSRVPCWAGSDGTMRCLPSFLLAGGFQSGADGLAAQLTQHPHIRTV
jgi:hypothetical protein